MVEDIKVSVVCLVYNHSKYLRKCLDSFVMQKTDFSYEVIIHDDASTDNSQEIILDYTHKYPDIFKPILQTENQYSQRIDIMKTYLYPKASGKYIAICEGDDFWTDDSKLQCQADYMGAHSDCYCVAHSHIHHSCLANTDTIISRSEVDRDFSLKEIVEGTGGLFATNSLFMRREVCVDMPECFYNNYFGDYQLPIFAAILGRVHYMNKVMSCYNAFTENSWSATNANEEQGYISVKENIRLLTAVNDYYGGKYNDSFATQLVKLEVEKLYYEKKFKQIKSHEYYVNHKQDYPKDFRTKVFIGSISPKMLKVLRKIKSKIR